MTSLRRNSMHQIWSFRFFKWVFVWNFIIHMPDNSSKARLRQTTSYFDIDFDPIRSYSGVLPTFILVPHLIGIVFCLIAPQIGIQKRRMIFSYLKSLCLPYDPAMFFPHIPIWIFTAILPSLFIQRSAVSLQ